jgi:hypothetical protein
MQVRRNSSLKERRLRRSREKIYLDGTRGKLHTDCRLGLKAELIARKSGKQIGLPDARVSYQHHLEQIVILVVRLVRHLT